MILPFDKISRNDADKAGGKWASLGEMTHAGIAIPPGFVVLAETFEEFMDGNNLRAEIETILGHLDHNNVGSIEHASEKIQELIRGGIISEKTQKEIQKHSKTIKTVFVAVRSSATAEDWAEHAWAWQLDTYLNVPKTDIITKIQSCWASLFTPRALFYRSEKWLQDLHISVAVVVQSMVDAESAGVAFTVHPVTENTDEIVIEWSWWLGEAVVSGEVTPDSFVISKSSWEIISEHIAEKKKGIFRNTNGKNEWRNIEKHEQEISILSKDKLSELAKLIIKIENHYGFPCDVEWAHSKGKMYILQARPITTLQGKTNNIKKDWVNIWSWSWSFLSCTDFASALSHEVKILWETPFNNVRIFINNGKSACWVPQDQKDILWKKVADFYGNKKELEKVCQLFRESVDDFLKFFEKIKHKKIENKNYRKVWDLIVSEYRLHIIIKYIVDYLEPKLLDKFLPMLAEARVYAEPVFEKSEELMNNWIDEVAQKSKIESRYISCCTREEFQSAIKDSEYPDVWILAQRYVQSVIENDGKSQKIHTGNEAENIRSELTDVAEDWSIRWSCAYPGKLQWIVRIIHDPTADNVFHQGDILVTGMTRPEYIHLAKKSAGIITDAGGILSHAAITARELKIPCIIGTKNATQILKDGDIVEVDAENGIVNILKNSGHESSKDQWYLAVTRVFELLEIWMATEVYHNFPIKEGNYSMDTIVLWKNGMIERYLRRDQLDLFGEIARKGDFTELLNGFQEYEESVKHFFTKDPFINREEFIKIFRTLWSHEITGFFLGQYITDEKALNIIKHLRGTKSVQHIATWEFLPKLYKQISKHTHIDAALIKYALPEEIISLELNPKILAARKKHYIIESIGGHNKLLIGKESFIYAKKFITNIDNNIDINISEIKGNPAFLGKMTGKVIVITNEEDLIKVKKGHVLVTPMTRTSFLSALQRCGAYITDEWGITSHAAIMARELQKPCIIGTKIATKVLKNGDIVEVDAENGIVRKLN